MDPTFSLSFWSLFWPSPCWLSLYSRFGAVTSRHPCPEDSYHATSLVLGSVYRCTMSLNPPCSPRPLGGACVLSRPLIPRADSQGSTGHGRHQVHPVGIDYKNPAFAPRRVWAQRGAPPPSHAGPVGPPRHVLLQNTPKQRGLPSHAVWAWVSEVTQGPSAEALGGDIGGSGDSLKPQHDLEREPAALGSLEGTAARPRPRRASAVVPLTPVLATTMVEAGVGHKHADGGFCLPSSLYVEGERGSAVSGLWGWCGLLGVTANVALIRGPFLSTGVLGPPRPAPEKWLWGCRPPRLCLACSSGWLVWAQPRELTSGPRAV
jgi:hypothetical protein